MGLDNGIILRTRHEVTFPRELGTVECFDYGFVEDGETTDTFEYNICYWRKCYSLRQDIVGSVGMDYQTGDKALTIDDVKGIWHILNYYNNKKNWNNSESIWKWRDMKDTVRGQLLRLEWLIQYMRVHENKNDFTVFFYDSY